MAVEGSDAGDFIKEQNVFRGNAFQLVVEMEDMSTQTNGENSFLVDEILHSIFFLGRLTYPSLSPEDIFHGNEEFLGYLREFYPRPFNLYLSQLPRRSPFSCVLDMVVRLLGPDDEASIKDILQAITRTLDRYEKSKILFSSTLCVSSVPGARYYGVSMSTNRTPAMQIMIASGCLSYWHDCVAAAVMSYCPQKKRKDYFNGTFQLPAEVRCEAFDIHNQQPKAPCLSCKHLFFNLLATKETEKKSPYGNCAEPESLSNLFKQERNVRQQVQQSVNGRENNNRARAEKDVLTNLRQVLTLNYSGFTWDTHYYSAQ